MLPPMGAKSCAEHEAGAVNAGGDIQEARHDREGWGAGGGGAALIIQRRSKKN